MKVRCLGMDKLKVFHTNRGNGFFIEHVKRVNPYHMREKHYHSELEIYYLLAGDRNYFVQDRVYNVKKGDLVLVNTNVLHKTVDGFSDTHERILIEFNRNFFDGFLENNVDLEFLNAFQKDCNLMRLEESEKKLIESCFFKLIQESKENSINNNISFKVFFLELLVIINKIHAKKNNAIFEHPSKLHERISEIIAYMNLNYMRDIGLDYVAGEFFISPAHLSRAFRKVTGFSFVEYLNNLRVNEAGKLLTETTLSITEIATKVGYQNSTHFGRMFKTIIGSSPRDYRRYSQN